jgi:hypothetical protein
MVRWNLEDCHVLAKQTLNSGVSITLIDLDEERKSSCEVHKSLEIVFFFGLFVRRDVDSLDFEK